MHKFHIYEILNTQKVEIKFSLKTSLSKTKIGFEIIYPNTQPKHILKILLHSYNDYPFLLLI